MSSDAVPIKVVKITAYLQRTQISITAGEKNKKKINDVLVVSGVVDPRKNLLRNLVAI